MSDCYTVIAKYYDKFTHNDCDYVRWSQYLSEAASSRGVKEIVDLACGTGKMTQLLAQRGFVVTGVDESAEMLDEARSKLKATFVLQDMKKLALTHQTDMAVCVNDGVNYLSPRQIQPFFERVSANLKCGAPFVFDVSSERKLSDVIGNNVFYWDGEEETLLWSNRFDGKRAQMELTLFVRQSDGAYRRYDERHVQYVHTEDELRSALNGAGFDVLQVSNDYGKILKKDSLRLTFLAVKRYK